MEENFQLASVRGKRRGDKKELLSRQDARKTETDEERRKNNPGVSEGKDLDQGRESGELRIPRPTHQPNTKKKEKLLSPQCGSRDT